MQPGYHCGARGDVQLRENPKHVGADRPRTDIQDSSTDFIDFIGIPCRDRRDHSRDFLFPWRVAAVDRGRTQLDHCLQGSADGCQPGAGSVLAGLDGADRDAWVEDARGGGFGGVE